MTTPKLVIFNDTHGWHSQQLVAALSEYGIEAILSDLATCSIDLEQPTGLMIPELRDQLPAAVIVRGIAPGSLEQITLRMDILHHLAEQGVPVLNSAKAIEHTVDKARTSLRLRQAAIKTPSAWAFENHRQARNLVTQQLAKGHQLVLKPLFGCQGKGLYKITTLDDLDSTHPVGGAFYLQHYIPPFEPGCWQDWRLLVVDGQVCAAMSRRSQHWITNYAQGAECFAATINKEMEQLAIKATQVVEADYAGVDIIRGPEGEYHVLEVNSVPAWKGLTQATGINVAHFIASALAKRITKNCILANDVS